MAVQAQRVYMALDFNTGVVGTGQGSDPETTPAMKSSGRKNSCATAATSLDFTPWICFRARNHPGDKKLRLEEFLRHRRNFGFHSLDLLQGVGDVIDGLPENGSLSQFQDLPAPVLAGDPVALGGGPPGLVDGLFRQRALAQSGQLGPQRLQGLVAVGGCGRQAGKEVAPPLQSAQRGQDIDCRTLSLLQSQGQAPAGAGSQVLQHGKGRHSRIGGLRPQKSGLSQPGMPLPGPSLEDSRPGQALQIVNVFVFDAGDAGAPPPAGKPGGKGAPLHVSGNDHHRPSPLDVSPVPSQQVLATEGLKGCPLSIRVSAVGMGAVGGPQEQSLHLPAGIVQPPCGAQTQGLLLSRNNLLFKGWTLQGFRQNIHAGGEIVGETVEHKAKIVGLYHGIHLHPQPLHEGGRMGG